ncbi:uncharacterized protein CMU_009830 [Cryptosporidium muris RN66]|uniref:Uncharacterized protein n=1 Tax=Cryptosporidium muris (strain RN66) TaxID=441375 RepID=B6AE50_CRYMR|nr:uncharacterized protein CMU_009830 [Cryptosporidium muris RN66]EEA06491.1 hypothetical protein, conserved [Cryptosporidium muris RN66]|eukprot:XP_002140840.1 hypothetical protein [Cryptosporidium muris RN66]
MLTRKSRNICPNIEEDLRAICNASKNTNFGYIKVICEKALLSFRHYHDLIRNMPYNEISCIRFPATDVCSACREAIVTSTKYSDGLILAILGMNCLQKILVPGIIDTSHAITILAVLNEVSMTACFTSNFKITAPRSSTYISGTQNSSSSKLVSNPINISSGLSSSVNNEKEHILLKVIQIALLFLTPGVTEYNESIISLLISTIANLCCIKDYPQVKQMSNIGIRQLVNFSLEFLRYSEISGRLEMTSSTSDLNNTDLENRDLCNNELVSKIENSEQAIVSLLLLKDLAVMIDPTFAEYSEINSNSRLSKLSMTNFNKKNQKLNTNTNSYKTYEAQLNEITPLSLLKGVTIPSDLCLDIWHDILDVHKTSHLINNNDFANLVANVLFPTLTKCIIKRCKILDKSLSQNLLEFVTFARYLRLLIRLLNFQVKGPFVDDCIFKCLECLSNTIDIQNFKNIPSWALQCILEMFSDIFQDPIAVLRLGQCRVNDNFDEMNTSLKLEIPKETRSTIDFQGKSNCTTYDVDNEISKIQEHEDTIKEFKNCETMKCSRNYIKFSGNGLNIVEYILRVLTNLLISVSNKLNLLHSSECSLNLSVSTFLNQRLSLPNILIPQPGNANIVCGSSISGSSNSNLDQQKIRLIDIVIEDDRIYNITKFQDTKGAHTSKVVNISSSINISNSSPKSSSGLTPITESNQHSKSKNILNHSASSNISQSNSWLISSVTMNSLNFIEVAILIIDSQISLISCLFNISRIILHNFSNDFDNVLTNLKTNISNYFKLDIKENFDSVVEQAWDILCKSFKFCTNFQLLRWHVYRAIMGLYAVVNCSNVKEISSKIIDILTDLLEYEINKIPSEHISTEKASYEAILTAYKCNLSLAYQYSEYFDIQEWRYLFKHMQEIDDILDFGLGPMMTESSNQMKVLTAESTILKMAHETLFTESFSCISLSCLTKLVIALCEQLESIIDNEKFDFTHCSYFLHKLGQILKSNPERLLPIWNQYVIPTLFRILEFAQNKDCISLKSLEHVKTYSSSRDHSLNAANYNPTTSNESIYFNICNMILSFMSSVIITVFDTLGNETNENCRKKVNGQLGNCNNEGKGVNKVVNSDIDSLTRNGLRQDFDTISRYATSEDNDQKLNTQEVQYNEFLRLNSDISSVQSLLLLPYFDFLNSFPQYACMFLRSLYAILCATTPKLDLSAWTLLVTTTGIAIELDFKDYIQTIKLETLNITEDTCVIDGHLEFIKNKSEKTNGKLGLNHTEELEILNSLYPLLEFLCLETEIDNPQDLIITSAWHLLISSIAAYGRVPILNEGVAFQAVSLLWKLGDVIGRRRLFKQTPSNESNHIYLEGIQGIAKQIGIQENNEQILEDECDSNCLSSRKLDNINYIECNSNCTSKELHTQDEIINSSKNSSITCNVEDFIEYSCCKNKHEIFIYNISRVKITRDLEASIWSSSSASEESIWLHLILQLKSLCRDTRQEVRNCALRSLYSALISHCRHFNWQLLEFAMIRTVTHVLMEIYEEYDGTLTTSSNILNIPSEIKENDYALFWESSLEIAIDGTYRVIREVVKVVSFNTYKQWINSLFSILKSILVSSKFSNIGRDIQVVAAKTLCETLLIIPRNAGSDNDQLWDTGFSIYWGICIKILNESHQILLYQKDIEDNRSITLSEIGKNCLSDKFAEVLLQSVIDILTYVMFDNTNNFSKRDFNQIITLLHLTIVIMTATPMFLSTATPFTTDIISDKELHNSTQISSLDSTAEYFTLFESKDLSDTPIDDYYGPIYWGIKHIPLAIWGQSRFLDTPNFNLLANSSNLYSRGPAQLPTSLIIFSDSNLNNYCGIIYQYTSLFDFLTSSDNYGETSLEDLPNVLYLLKNIPSKYQILWWKGLEFTHLNSIQIPNNQKPIQPSKNKKKVQGLKSTYVPSVTNSNESLSSSLISRIRCLSTPQSMGLEVLNVFLIFMPIQIQKNMFNSNLQNKNNYIREIFFCIIIEIMESFLNPDIVYLDSSKIGLACKIMALLVRSNRNSILACIYNFKITLESEDLKKNQAETLFGRYGLIIQEFSILPFILKKLSKLSCITSHTGKFCLWIATIETILSIIHDWISLFAYLDETVDIIETTILDKEETTEVSSEGNNNNIINREQVNKVIFSSNVNLIEEFTEILTKDIWPVIVDTLNTLLVNRYETSYKSENQNPLDLFLVNTIVDCILSVQSKLKKSQKRRFRLPVKYYKVLVTNLDNFYENSKSVLDPIVSKYILEKLFDIYQSLDSQDSTYNLVEPTSVYIIPILYNRVRKILHNFALDDIQNGLRPLPQHRIDEVHVTLNKLRNLKVNQANIRTHNQETRYNQHIADLYPQLIECISCKDLGIRQHLKKVLLKLMDLHE